MIAKREGGREKKREKISYKTTEGEWAGMNTATDIVAIKSARP